MNFRTLAPGRLTPADLKKDANGFDLPIALGLLLASGQLAFDRPGNYAIVGELALTGDTRPIKEILAMALQAVSEGRDGLLVPTANAAEAAVVEGLNVYPVGSLAEAVGFLTGQVDMDPEAVDLDELFAQHSHMEEDFADVKGQDYAKRALLIAAAGSHNVLTLWSISPPKDLIPVWSPGWYDERRTSQQPPDSVPCPSSYIRMLGTSCGSSSAMQAGTSPMHVLSTNC